MQVSFTIFSLYSGDYFGYFISNSCIEQFLAELSKISGSPFKTRHTLWNYIIYPPWEIANTFNSFLFVFWFPSTSSLINFLALSITSFQDYAPSHLYYLIFFPSFLAFSGQDVSGFPSSTPPNFSLKRLVYVTGIYFNFGAFSTAFCKVCLVLCKSET